jgi:serine/threonine-protein kinase
MSSLAGQRFGQYELIEIVGSGGMATVYLATQESIGREVAVKVLPRIFTHDATFIERFTREVQVIARMQHPHILPVHDFGENEGQPYIVMAYLDGGTLSDHIDEGPMPLADTRRTVRQVCDALDYAHGQGIIHRDLKPSNVLLDRQGNAYLADFGIAKVTESTAQLTGSGMVGTPAYMAPEMAQPGGVTALVDVYALGVTVYQMLAGRAPYEADTPMGILLAHVSSPIPDIRLVRPDLPNAVQEVINGSMAKMPEMRYSSPGVVAEALEAAASGAPLPVLESVPSGEGATVPMSPLPESAVTAAGVARPGTQVAGGKRTLSPFLIGGGLVGLLVLTVLGAFLGFGGVRSLFSEDPTPTATATPTVVEPTATPSLTPSPTETPPPTDTPEPTAALEETAAVTATFEFTYTPRPGSTSEAGATSESGATAEGGARVEYQPYYYCRTLGGESYEWYGVNIYYDENGAVTNKEIVDGPHVGDWKPGCGAALSPDAYVEATSAVATLYSPDWQPSD